MGTSVERDTLILTPLGRPTSFLTPSGCGVWGGWWLLAGGQRGPATIFPGALMQGRAVIFKAGEGKLFQLYRAGLGTNIRRIPVQALKDPICKTNPRRFFLNLDRISARTGPAEPGDSREDAQRSGTKFLGIFPV